MLKIETDKYVVEYKFINRINKAAILLKSKESGGHGTIHTKFNLLNSNNEIITTPEIDENIAKFIIASFHKKGDTESFNIYEDELKTGKFDLIKKNVNVEEIRHQLSKAEENFTATGTKLYYHWPIFKKFKETGYQSIIRTTLTLHQVCVSKCHYCSTIGRNKSDSINLDEAKEFISKLYFNQADFNQKNFETHNKLYKKITGTDIRLRGLILSGGGQPNLWPYFEEFVSWCSKLDIDIGLITNGFPKSIDEEIYTKFKWIRVSITPEDASPHYIEGKFNKQYFPETIKRNSNIKVGLSYVYGPWTTDDVLMRIDLAIKEFGFDYCRVLADCNLTRNAQLIAHKNLADKLNKLKLIDNNDTTKSKFFHQLKYHGSKMEANDIWSEGYCYLQIYNVFWDTTGHDENGYSYCYPCDSITVLAEENESGIISPERKFNYEKWGTVKNTEIEHLFRKPYEKYFDPRQNCVSCLFMKNNKIVKELINTNNYENIVLQKDLDHINFP